MEDKILALYACGMSQRGIAEQIKELYDVEISPELVTKISEKIMPEVTAWQNRPLENVYPFVFMDAIHYKVKEDHRYITKAAYVVLGITMDGRKDILGVWIGEHVIQAEVQKSYAQAIGEMGPAISAGGGGSGNMGDLLGLGVGMAAASTVAPQIGNIMKGIQFPNVGGEAAPAAPAAEGWECQECGTKNIQSRFCPNCGGRKPEPKAADTWDCPACGAKNIRSKFCPECGAKKPEKGWTCPSCGRTDIVSKFCPECGAKKPEAPAAWICPACGEKGITGKFCPNCGAKKPD